MKKMKWMFLCLLALCGFMGTALAQVINVPHKAKEQFKKKYPGAQQYDWHNNVTDYVCKFKMNNHDYVAHYRLDGTWNYTEQKLTAAELPAVVKDSDSKSRYADWELKSVARVDSHKKTNLYRLEKKKGIEEVFVFYDKKGKEAKANFKL